MVKINERGFTLIEMLVAAGIMSVVVLAFASVISNMNRQLVRATNLAEAEQSVRMLDKILQNQDNCDFNLKDANIPNRTFAVGSSGAKVPITKIEIPSGAGAKRILGVGDQITPNMWVKALGFSDMSQVASTNEFLGELYIEMSDVPVGSSDAAKSQVIVKQMPISLGTSWVAGDTSTQITACGTGQVGAPPDTTPDPDPPASSSCTAGSCVGVFGNNFPDRILCGGTLYHAVKKGVYRCHEGGAKSTRSAEVKFNSSGNFVSQDNPTKGSCGTCSSASLSSIISSGKAF